jgi:hypothetical protein
MSAQQASPMLWGSRPSPAVADRNLEHAETRKNRDL